jgi:hypothetical protein
MRLDELKFGFEQFDNLCIIPLRGKHRIEVWRGKKDETVFSIFVEPKERSVIDAVGSPLESYTFLPALQAQCILYELLNCNPQE